MTRRFAGGLLAGALSGILALVVGLSVDGGIADRFRQEVLDTRVDQRAQEMIDRGRETFRHDTMGDESFWTGALRLNEAIAGEALGGVGPGVSPATALAVGLKVDVEALPDDLKSAIARGEIDLDSPATTVALLGLDAVVGVKGRVGSDGSLDEVGITCALCHSTVDDAFAPGIGRRLDGWANRDLDVGAIIALAPDLGALASHLSVDQATVRQVLGSWGPGRFDAGLLLDGKAFRPDGKSASTLIPPAYGLAGVNLHTWTGWGSVTHWNAFVANLEMNGRGNFYDPRLDDPVKFPFAARSGMGNVRTDDDRVTPKLADLQVYQLVLEAPAPPPGSFDAAAAARGEVLFAEKADCARCHVPPIYTEPGWNMHRPEEIGIDGFQASRSPDEAYRTAPLRGLWAHQKGGFYHDGRFATLGDVIDHYDEHFALGLSEAEKSDLAEFLKSL